MYKQTIIARKDLNMSHGKMAAQVSHASMAFLTNLIRKEVEAKNSYEINITIDSKLYEEWIYGSFTKVVLAAKNKNHLLKAVKIAEELGLQENRDFFLIYDNCLTELTPEEENGTTLTCIGFAPMDEELTKSINKKFQLF